MTKEQAAEQFAVTSGNTYGYHHDLVVAAFIAGVNYALGDEK